MAKRSDGTGSIYVTNDGRYRGAVTMPDGKRRFVSGKNRSEVANKIKALQRHADDGTPPGDAMLTVADFLDRWLSDVLPVRATVKSQNTIDGYECAMRKHIIPALGHHKLRALTPDHIDAFLKAKAESGLSRSTIMRLRAMLVTSITWAERRELVHRNAARLSEMPVNAKPPAEGRALTLEQATKLLDTAKGDRLEALWLTGLMLGLRPGELLALTWADVDLDGATLQVRRSLKREVDKSKPKGQRQVLRLGEPKTKRSRRALDLPAQVVGALRVHKRHQAEERLIAGPEWVEHDLIFPTAFGRPMDPSNLRRSFDKLTNAAGLDHWHPHELRHSAASLLSAAGVPLERVADVLGHDGTRMAALVYRHAVAPTVSAGVAPMEAMFSG